MLSAKKELFTPSGGAYQISRSVRLRNSATGYFSRTIGATATNAKIGTLSMWVKRGGLTSATGNSQYLIQTGISATTDSGHFTMYFTTSDNLSLGQYSWAGYSTTQVFRDPSAWYHIVLSYNSTLASNNLTIYVNGVQIAVTSVVQNTNWAILSGTEAINIGRHTSVGRSFDGYLTEINLIDGQALTPSSFGETNSVTGVWQPKKYAGTYGTNGFYLNFSDNSGATASTIGKDYSGNGNNWTPNNISVTAGATYDSMLDVPTQWADGGNGRGNYAVLNPLNKATSDISLSSGNLEASSSFTSDHRCFASTFQVTSGKWYWEVQYATGTINAGSNIVGIFNLPTPDTANNRRPADSVNNGIGIRQDGQSESDNTSAAYFGSSISVGDIIGIKLDADAGTVAFNVNGGSFGSTLTFVSAGGVYTPGGDIRASSGTPKTIHNFGQRPFSYTPPTGFKALNTLNLPTPTISNGAQYMAATLYSGNSGTQSITNTVNGVSFQPDFVWGKSRNIAENHALFDIVRGVNKTLYANLTNAEATDPGVSAFNSNGFTLNGATINATGYTYVAWQWNAGGSTVTNTSGTISAQVRANPTAGFSVLTYTGTGSAATIGHGLGVAPQMIIIFERSPGGDDHIVYHASLTSNQYSIRLNTTAAQAGASGAYWNSTSPTSSVFSVGTSGESNQSTATYVAYCFAPVAGYSAFGKYTGNGSADGPFVFTGFRPRFVMVKRTDAVDNWAIFDTSRLGYNADNNELLANTSSAEGTADFIDILSNGFKNRNSDSRCNASGGTYIYAAFAEVPFRYANAR